MIVAKYKFDKSIYENLIPVFDDGYEGYTVSDEIDSENSNHIIRTIECDSLPTRIKFGSSNEANFKPQRDSLLELIYLNTTNIVNMTDMFAQCINLTSINTEGWDTSNVSTMFTMFYGCKKLTSLDLSNWDTSKVDNMNYMFYNCNNLTSITFGSNFNTSNVTSMSNMFSACNNLTSLDLSNFNTSKVTNMYAMFYGCNNLTSLDVSNWNTSNVTSMKQMFYCCESLTSLDVSNWDTSKVTNMWGIFQNCFVLKTIDVSRWNTSNATNMCQLFFQCNAITSLDVSNFDTSNVTDMSWMFTNCIGLTSLDISNFDTSKVTDMRQMFRGIDINMKIKEIVFGDIDIHSHSINYERMFENCIYLEKIYIPNLSFIEILHNIIPDRTGQTTGQIVTTLRDQIDEETMAVLVAKNWQIKDLVAQYRYDANTYEDLIPEFNTEFNSDKYEIYDSVSEIVIDNIKWTVESNNKQQASKFIPVLSNVTYIPDKPVNTFWYDSNKQYISGESWDGAVKPLEPPTNAKYVKFTQNINHGGCILSAKLITRSIESKNGDLPTLMRFGLNTDVAFNNYGNKELCLLRVNAINTKKLSTAEALFRQCRRMMYCNTTDIDTSNISSFASTFQDCQLLTSLDVSNWDTSNVTSMGNIVQNCKKLTSLDVSGWDTGNVTSMYGMFRNCTNLTSLDVSNWNTSKVTTMSDMFQGCHSLTSLDVSNFNTSKVTNMASMFYNCNKLTSLDVSNFDTSKVTSMGSMFYGCTNLTSLDVSNFDTKNVNNMSSMFYGCTNLTSLDISNFNTSNVTDMGWMFWECNNLTTLDVSNFNTSKVTNMRSMFYNCKSLTSIDVSNFNTSNVKNMYNMFYGCNNLTSIDVSNFNTSNVTNMGSMFWKCTSIKTLILSNWNMSEGVNISNIFCTNGGIVMSLETLDMPNSEITTLANTDNLFYIDDESLSPIKNIRCNNVNTINNVILPNIPTRSSDNKGQIITSAELSQDIVNALTSKNWTVVSSDTLTKVAEYVYDSNTWNSLIPIFNDEFVEYFIDDEEDENGLVTRTISSLGGLPTLMRFGVKYPNPTSFKEKSLYNVNYIDISNLISANEMFRYCTNLMSINTANWDTSKITNMGNMFFNCSNLISLDVSNFDTSNVYNMGYMFCNCQKLISLDVSNFNTSNVTTMSYMFCNCQKLISLDVSNFDTSNVTNMQNIFNNTPKLSDIGMLYCTPSTINTISSVLPTTHTQTIWVQDAKPSEYTVVSGVEFKEYKENSVMINLSSPLLQGDRIEVVDGKLCHYHKMGMVVLDGSENWRYYTAFTNTVRFAITDFGKRNGNGYCDIVPYIQFSNDDLMHCKLDGSGSFIVWIDKYRLSALDVPVFRQWLQQNPTTVVYELAEPYYEDITPLQSDIVLETYLECNMDIYTDLPIKTNLTYLTNITNTSSIEEEINAINEGTDLTNLLEDEINN